VGIIYRVQGNVLKAELSLRSAIDLYREMHAHYYQAIAALDLGNVYLKSDRPAEAEALYREAKEGIQAAGSLRAHAQVLNNLGMACARQGKWALAEDSFERSIALWQQLGEPVGQANAEDNLAETYLDQEKWEAAIKVLRQTRQRLAGLEPMPRIDKLRGDIDEHLEMARQGLAGQAGR
jgi:tetratricopeptide (TPR) repeat protein